MSLLTPCNHDKGWTGLPTRTWKEVGIRRHVQMLEIRGYVASVVVTVMRLSGQSLTRRVQSQGTAPELEVEAKGPKGHSQGLVGSTMS